MLFIPVKVHRIITPEFTESIMKYIESYVNIMSSYFHKRQKIIELPKEATEFWVAESLRNNHGEHNIKELGAGNTSIDIIYDTIGIDVKCMCTKGAGLSNETSLIQNFKTIGTNLDNMFINGEYDLIRELWTIELRKKYLACINKFNLTELIFIVFLSTRKNVFLTIFNLNIELLPNSCLGVGRLKPNSLSINLSNLINEYYGQTKIYKAKKRIELRLNLEHLCQENLVNIIYTMI